MHWLTQIQSVLDDRDPSVRDSHLARLDLPLGVDEIANVESQGSAVGEESVEVGVGIARWRLGLVLRVNDPNRMTDSPVAYEVRPQLDLPSIVEHMTIL